MKTLLATILLILTLASAQAAILGAPFLPEIDARFNAIEQGNVIKQSNPIGAADGHTVKQVVQATYDFGVQTGATGTYDLGVGLPKNAEIVRSYIYSITKPTTSASGTLAFWCQNQTVPGGNILMTTAAASFAAAASAIDGIQTGAAANFSTVTAPCDIKATIATGALTAGKVTVFLEYVTHQ